VEIGLPELVAQSATPNFDFWEAPSQIAAIRRNGFKRNVTTGRSRAHNLSQNLTAVTADIQTIRVGFELGTDEFCKSAIGVGRPDIEPCVSCAEQWLDG
jgi:hypothetical protein